MEGAVEVSPGSDRPEFDVPPGRFEELRDRRPGVLAGRIVVESEHETFATSCETMCNGGADVARAEHGHGPIPKGADGKCVNETFGDHQRSRLCRCRLWPGQAGVGGEVAGRVESPSSAFPHRA